MTITLKQAVTINAEINKRVENLMSELDRVSVVEFEKGEDYEMPSRTMADVEKDITEAQNDLRKLEVLMAVANVTNTLTWNGKDLTILEAISLNKQNRTKAKRFQRQANRKKVENQRYSNPPIYVKVLYDPDEKRQKAEKLNAIANKLSDLIDTKNASITLDFDASKYIAQTESLDD